MWCILLYTCLHAVQIAHKSHIFCRIKAIDRLSHLGVVRREMTIADPVVDVIQEPLTGAEQRVLAKLEPREWPVPIQPLNPRERLLLVAFEDAIRQYGNPSIREIAAVAGATWYASNVHRYLKRLTQKGYVWMPVNRFRIRGVRLLFTVEDADKMMEGK